LGRGIMPPQPRIKASRFIITTINRIVKDF
jgi:hypothetical protein